MTVTSPAGGTTDFVGNVQPITWTNNFGTGATVNIDLSRDGGGTWTRIASAVANSTASGGTFNWTATAPPTTTAKIRITWTTNTSIAATTDNFTILSPTMAVTAPAGGTNWRVGSVQTISWTNNFGADATVNLDVSRNNGNTWSRIASAVSNSSASGGSFNWTVTSPTTSNARVRAVWTANSNVTGTTGNFTIANPTITVTNPDSSTAVWSVGTTATITWTDNLGPLENVQIQLSLDGGSTYGITLASSISSTGSMSVTVQPSWVTSRARVRVRWVTNTSVSDSSHQNFTIR
jgi:hypothetical protein